MRIKNLPKLLLPILLFWGCGGGQEEAVVEVSLRPVKYAVVGHSGGGASHTFSGIAQAEKEAKLSFRVAGTIRTLSVKLGDRVRRGQLIAALDPIDYSIQADQASASEKGSEANLQSAENSLVIARANYQRIEKLYENNSVPLSEFEQAKSNFETAESQYEAGQTQLTSAKKQTQTARNQVSYTRLVAPFDGVITAVNVESNELVSTGSPVAVLSSITRPEINVGIPENIISQIKVGQAVDIHFSVFPNQTFAGTVQEVSFAAGSAPTYPAIVRINNASEAIRPGMAATVSFDLSGERVEKRLVSPVPAIGKGPDGNFAFVLEAAGEAGEYKVAKRGVNVGPLGPDGFEVLDGLAEGELVATAGIKSLLDGMVVTLLEEE